MKKMLTVAICWFIGMNSSAMSKFGSQKHGACLICEKTAKFKNSLNIKGSGTDFNRNINSNGNVSMSHLLEMNIKKKKLARLSHLAVNSEELQKLIEKNAEEQKKEKVIRRIITNAKARKQKNVVSNKIERIHFQPSTLHKQPYR